MKKLLGVFALACVASGWFAFTAAPVMADPVGFAADYKGPNKGTLYSIDLATGAPTAIGPTGQDDISGLSLSCDGTLFAVNRLDNGDRQPNQLVTIDTVTGASTVVGPLDVEPADSGLTFGIDGKLYMTNVNTGELYVVDTSTAKVSSVGSVGEGIEITGLATRADGVIFGFDRGNNQLVTVDPATGAATIIGPSSDLNLTGLDFDSAGTLWGVSNKGAIVTFDTTTGAAAPVSTYDITKNTFQSLALGPQGCTSVETTTNSPPPTTAAAASVAPSSSSTAKKSDSSSSVPIVLIVVALAAIVAIVVFVASRRRRDDDQ